jgi:hypothetical protein
MPFSGLQSGYAESRPPPSLAGFHLGTESAGHPTPPAERSEAARKRRDSPRSIQQAISVFVTLVSPCRPGRRGSRRRRLRRAFRFYRRFHRATGGAVEFVENAGIDDLKITSLACHHLDVMGVANGRGANFLRTRAASGYERRRLRRHNLTGKFIRSPQPRRTPISFPGNTDPDR